jgi:hypothetical protein
LPKRLVYYQPQPMGAVPQATSKLLQPTLKKGFQIHYFNPTNPKPQPNPKTKTKSQPEKKLRTENTHYNN